MHLVKKIPKKCNFVKVHTSFDCDQNGSFRDFWFCSYSSKAALMGGSQGYIAACFHITMDHIIPNISSTMEFLYLVFCTIIIMHINNKISRGGGISIYICIFEEIWGIHNIWLA